MKYLCFSLFLIFGLITLRAQQPERMSLRQCITEALNNSETIQRAALEVQKAERRHLQVFGTLLPQIEGFATYDNYLKIPVQMVPGEIFGQPGATVPISLYVQHNISAGLRANLLLYNQSVLLSLSIANTAKDAAGINSDIARNEIIYGITKLYYTIKSTEYRIRNLEDTMERMRKLKDISSALKEAGEIREIDVKRVGVNLDNLSTEIKQFRDINSAQFYLLLRSIGRDIPKSIHECQIILTDSLCDNDAAKLISEPQFSSIQRSEIKMYDKQIEIANLNKKLSNCAHFPVLSAYGSYYFQAQREKFDFFKHEANTWTNVGVAGLSLSLPIFNGLTAERKMEEAEIDAQIAAITAINGKRSFDADNLNALNSLMTAMEALEKTNNSADIAREVYEKTLLQYKSGAAQLNDVLQTQMEFNEILSGQASARLQLCIAKLDLLKARGVLMIFYNEIKK